MNLLGLTSFEKKLINSGSLYRLPCRNCALAVEGKMGTACGWKPELPAIGFSPSVNMFWQGLPEQKAIHGPWDEDHPKFTDRECPQFLEKSQ